MTHARSIRALRLAALAAALTALTAPVAGAQRSPPIRRALPLAPDGSVRVYVLSGRVSVVGGDVDSVIVTGTAPARQPFHMGGGPRGVKLGVWDETATGSVAPADLEVRVPRRARVWVKAGQTADVDVREVTGGLDVNIVAGTVRVRGAPRELNVEAMDGSVEIVGSPAWMRVKTASGVITLRGGSEDVALSSVSGAIRVSGGRVTRGRFENVTGDIRFDAAPDRGGALTFDTPRRARGAAPAARRRRRLRGHHDPRHDRERAQHGLAGRRTRRPRPRPVVLHRHHPRRHDHGAELQGTRGAAGAVGAWRAERGALSAPRRSRLRAGLSSSGSSLSASVPG
jgi:hypothetical protein